MPFLRKPFVDTDLLKPVDPKLLDVKYHEPKNRLFGQSRSNPYLYEGRLSLSRSGDTQVFHFMQLEDGRDVYLIDSASAEGARNLRWSKYSHCRQALAIYDTATRRWKTMHRLTSQAKRRIKELQLLSHLT